MSIIDDYMIKRIAICSPSSSWKSIRATLLAKGTNVNHVTVSRRLTSEIFPKSNKAACMPRLTTAMKCQRLYFARNIKLVS